MIKTTNLNFDPQTLPQNVQAEQAVLSAILLNNRAWEKISDFLRSEHFSHPAHAAIYSVIERQLARGYPVDNVTIKNYLDQQGILDDVGGIGYLSELMNAGTSVMNTEQYARLVYDHALRRQLIHVGQTITETAFVEHLDLPATKQIEIAEQQLYDLASTGEIERGAIGLGAALRESLEATEIAYKQDGQIAGLTTGFVDIDKKMGGLHSSDLIILAGRPGMGKTALALNFAFNAAHEIAMGRVSKKHSGVVAFFSLEMSADQLASRILSNVAEVPYHKMRNGTITDSEFMTLTERSRVLEKLPLYIDDTPGISVPMIRTRARRLKRMHGGLAMIVIDYIQLLTAPGGNKSDNRVQEISEMTRGLKMLAKELNVPVVALSQLSRAVESRDDKRPILSDLRESGSIEQDADIVTFTYRHEYYLQNRDPSQKLNAKGPDIHLRWEEEMKRAKNRAEFIIAKQRHGPTGTIPMGFFGEFSRFTDMLPGTYGPETVQQNYNTPTAGATQTVAEPTIDAPGIEIPDDLPDDFI